MKLTNKPDITYFFDVFLYYILGDKNQFFEELMKDFEANKNQCSQIKIGKQSMFPSNHINEFSQSAINNPSLSR